MKNPEAELVKGIVAERIKQIREDAGMNQTAFAAALGGEFTQDIISRYERGAADPTPYRLIKIAEFGNVSVDWLLGQTNDRGGDTPEIDQIGLNSESIRILKEMKAMKGKRRDETGHVLMSALNTLLRSPYLRKFLIAINDLELTASWYCSQHLAPEGQQRNEDNRKMASYLVQNEEELKDYLETFAQGCGYFVSVVTDPNTVIQMKTEAVAVAAREIAGKIAAYETTEYIEMMEEEEAKKRRAAQKKQPHSEGE